jgi:CDP-diacylglycerol--glycerol-3-phosphate 3-phosphatidyltransferase
MANAITLSRIPLLILVVILLTEGSPGVRIATMPLVLILILMDTLDGIVARRRGEVSLVGSKLDIAVDRAVELVLWVVYAKLGMIPLAIPVIFIIRGTVVDSVRSFSLLRGETPFGMMHSRWGKWLVASPAMRTSYGVAKGLAFCTLALALGLGGTDATAWARGMKLFAQVVSWISTAYCIIRGVPVLVEGRSLLADVVAGSPAVDADEADR